MTSTQHVVYFFILCKENLKVHVLLHRKTQGLSYKDQQLNAVRGNTAVYSVNRTKHKSVGQFWENWKVFLIEAFGTYSNQCSFKSLKQLPST